MDGEPGLLPSREGEGKGYTAAPAAPAATAAVDDEKLEEVAMGEEAGAEEAGRLAAPRADSRRALLVVVVVVVATPPLELGRCTANVTDLPPGEDITPPLGDLSPL